MRLPHEWWQKTVMFGGWSLLAGAELKLIAGVWVGAGSCHVPFVLRMVFLIFGPWRTSSGRSWFFAVVLMLLVVRLKQHHWVVSSSAPVGCPLWVPHWWLSYLWSYRQNQFGAGAASSAAGVGMVGVPGHQWAEWFPTLSFTTGLTWAPFAFSCWSCTKHSRFEDPWCVQTHIAWYMQCTSDAERALVCPGFTDVFHICSQRPCEPFFCGWTGL